MAFQSSLALTALSHFCIRGRWEHLGHSRDRDGSSRPLWWELYRQLAHHSIFSWEQWYSKWPISWDCPSFFWQSGKASIGDMITCPPRKWQERENSKCSPKNDWTCNSPQGSRCSPAKRDLLSQWHAQVSRKYRFPVAWPVLPLNYFLSLWACK